MGEGWRLGRMRPTATAHFQKGLINHFIGHAISLFFNLKKKLMFTYFEGQREEQTLSRGGTEREGDIEYKAGSKI